MLDYNRVKEKYGTYHSIFSTLFSASAAAISKEHAVATGRDPNDLPLGHELIVESYDVTHGVYPDEERCREADGVLITGSGEFGIVSAIGAELLDGCMGSSRRLDRPPRPGAIFRGSSDPPSAWGHGQRRRGASPSAR